MRRYILNAKPYKIANLPELLIRQGCVEADNDEIRVLIRQDKSEIAELMLKDGSSCNI
jgi:hypothetical protein